MKRIKPYLIGGTVGMVVLLAALGAFTVLAAPELATGCFPDTNGHWAETFICFVEEYGIVGGYGDGTFKPDNNITRAEASVMFQNTLKVLRAEGYSWGTNKGLLSVYPQAIPSGSTDQFCSVDITAPSDGGLVINTFINLDCRTTTGLSFCLESDGQVYNRINGGYSGRQEYHLDGGASGEAANAANVSMSTYYKVGPGTHTVDIEVDNSGPYSTYAASCGINVLFVPFDGEGVVAVSAEE